MRIASLQPSISLTLKHFLNTPSFNLLDCLQSIASAMHPDGFPLDPGLKRLHP
jgi:hypothetical protein